MKMQKIHFAELIIITSRIIKEKSPYEAPTNALLNLGIHSNKIYAINARLALNI